MNKIHSFVFRFTLWALLFVMTRLLTLTLSVLTFGFGLARVENPVFSIVDGNFNVLTVRYKMINVFKKLYNSPRCYFVFLLCF